MQPVSDHRSVRDEHADQKNKDNTNSRHLELYTILGEYDNAGFLLCNTTVRRSMSRYNGSWLDSA